MLRWSVTNPQTGMEKCARSFLLASRTMIKVLLGPRLTSGPSVAGSWPDASMQVTVVCRVSALKWLEHDPRHWREEVGLQPSALTCMSEGLSCREVDINQHRVNEHCVLQWLTYLQKSLKLPSRSKQTSLKGGKWFQYVGKRYTRTISVSPFIFTMDTRHLHTRKKPRTTTSHFTVSRTIRKGFSIVFYPHQQLFTGKLSRLDY